MSHPCCAPLCNRTIEDVKADCVLINKGGLFCRECWRYDPETGEPNPAKKGESRQSGLSRYD